VLDIPISGSPNTPNSAAWMDAGLAAMAQTPLTHEERLAVLLLVTGQARWCGAIVAVYARVQRETGEGEDSIAAREDAMYRELITADGYPALREAIDAGVFLAEGDPFGFGFARSLDGVEAYIARAAAGHHDDARPWVELEDAAVLEDKKYRDAQRAVRDAERALRAAQKLRRQALREAGERVARRRSETT